VSCHTPFFLYLLLQSSIKGFTRYEHMRHIHRRTCTLSSYQGLPPPPKKSSSYVRGGRTISLGQQILLLFQNLRLAKSWMARVQIQLHSLMQQCFLEDSGQTPTDLLMLENRTLKRFCGHSIMQPRWTL
jgi:hypothetical protein